MFDLSRLTDLVEGLLGNGATIDGASVVLQQLQDAGLDPAQLDGLDAGSFMAMLGEHGLEVSQLDLGQLSQLADQIGVELPVGDLIETFVSRSPGE